LLKLALRHPQSPAYTYWSNGEVNLGDRWDVHGQPRLPLDATISGIEHNNSLVILKSIDEDSVFGPLIRQIQNRILDLIAPRIRNDVTTGRGTLLLASPGRVTSFHFDADVNFLFQIAGNKLFAVFDRGPGRALRDEELERYFMGDPNGAQYDPSREKCSTVYQLRAGSGVHVPILTAHWARNLDLPSVALSVNFDLRSMMSVGRIYRLNGRLRKLGLRPVPPGSSRWRDAAKIAAMEVLSVRSHSH